MKIAVMGAGGVGGYFGARLAAAGETVGFVARGAHLDAMRRDGLRVLSPLGDVHLDPVRASDEAAEIGPVDVVIFAVKLWDTEAGALACRPLLAEGSVVISFQNGVESEAVLAESLGAEHVIGGVAQIAAVIAEPGLIRHSGTMARLIFGPRADGPSAPARAFLAACERAGIEATLTDDIERAIWNKFVFLAPLAGVTSVTRLPIGAVMADADIRALFRDAVAEAVAVGQARGVALDAATVDRVMDNAQTLPGGMKTSMQQDLERGGRLELPWLNGAVVHLGTETGVATPINRALYAALKAHAEGPPAVNFPLAGGGSG